MTRLNWKKRIYHGDSLNYIFCRYKMEGKTLSEITEFFVSLTGIEYEKLTGTLRLVNMRHEWLKNGWENSLNEHRSMFKIAKKDYIDEYMNLEGKIHEDVIQTIRNCYGGEYFPE